MRRMYSEEQLKRMAVEKIAQGGLEDVDVKVKTIEQSEPNASVDLSSLPMIDLNAGLDYQLIYGRFEQLGNVLYIVWTFSIENKTESNIGMANTSIIVELPSNIAEKIYDLNGKKVSESSTANISGDMALGGDNSYPNALNRKYMPWTINNESDANKLSLHVYGIGTINAGVKVFCSFRTFLTLI